MFHLHKEIDEIRFEYYISHSVEDSFIEFSLNDVTTLLNVSKSKAQRLVDKFITLGLLIVIEKSNSKNKKTKYRYISSIFNTNINTANTSNPNTLPNVSDTNLDIYQQLIRIYSRIYGDELDPVTKEELKEYTEYVDLDLFTYLVKSFKNNPEIRKKDRYLIATLENLKENNIKDLDGYFRLNKEYVERNKKNDNRKNWNYSTESRVQEDFDIMAKMTRYK